MNRVLLHLSESNPVRCDSVSVDDRGFLPFLTRFSVLVRKRFAAFTFLVIERNPVLRFMVRRPANWTIEVSAIASAGAVRFQRHISEHGGRSLSDPWVRRAPSSLAPDPNSLCRTGNNSRLPTRSHRPENGATSLEVTMHSPVLLKMSASSRCYNFLQQSHSCCILKAIGLILVVKPAVRLGVFLVDRGLEQTLWRAK